ncbi:hypothetical protein TWF730_007503 [Orbilia blumenaviensis]|uniref:Uncharacterized protein n=1 Tax=Orbilia blumenaviensis TaxID=1796055 RepID=A0AAV9V8J9_9PEZI
MALMLTLILVLISLPYGLAFEWEDFTNNLATDLAPLIVLFGEQVTKQFLSESLSTWDNVIFAMAPLGVLTAVVSAIRVCGNASLRAFIGRAQESPGTAEVELLSCTSETTSELWHEGGIARVFGSPQILEVVKLKSEDISEKEYEAGNTAGIVLLTSEDSTWKAEGTSMDDETEKLQYMQYRRPNLSLNIGIKRQSEKFTYMATALGLILQAGVLIYAGLAAYQYPDRFLKDDKPMEKYAFPLTLIGTMSLCIGMFLCAYIIERSTDEVRYKQDKGASKMYWVQPGGQKIGDQVFGSFIGFSDDCRYIVSSRSQRRNKFDGVLWVTMVATILGFLLQFIGLRAMHSSVIVAQLGATILMAVIRAGLRTQRMEEERDMIASYKKQNKKDYQNLVQGHELDFFATQLENVDMLFFSFKQGGTPSETTKLSNGIRALRSRARLAKLTTEDTDGLSWKDVRVHEVAIQLQSAIEGIMEVLSTSLKTIAPDSTQYCCPINIAWTPKAGNDMKTEVFSLNFRKEGLAWKADCTELEAILGMWAWSLLRYKDGKKTSRLDKKNIRLIAAASDSVLNEAKTWYQVWIQRRLTLEERKTTTLDENQMVWMVGDRPLFGCQVLPDTTNAMLALYVLTQNSTLTMCAQDVFISVLQDTIQSIDNIGGKTEVRSQVDGQNTFLLQNNQVEEIANHFENSRLGSREDAYMCIIPMLMRESKLPEMTDVLTAIRKHVKAHRDDGKWKEAEQFLQWICYRSDIAETNKPYIELGDLYIAAMLQNELEAQVFGFGGARNMLKMAAQPQNNHTGLIKPANQCGWIGLRIATDIGDDKHRDELQRMVKNDEVPDYVDTSKLYEWARKDNITAIKYLIKKKGHMVDDRDNTGRSSLSWAAQNGNIDIATLLIENGADRNLCDKDGRAPLSYAAENGHGSLIRLLLNGDSGSLNTITKSDGKTSLILAAQNGHEASVEALLKEPSIRIDVESAKEGTALVRAVRGGYRGIVELLIDKGANVEGGALGIALENGSAEIVELLIDKGASVNVWALSSAAARGYTEIVELLIEKGANVDDGWALTTAAQRGHVKIVELLIDKGANFDGGSALMAAANGGHVNIVDLLIYKSADHNKGGALKVALEKGFAERSIDNDESFNVWALSFAAARGYTEIVELLIEKGVGFNEGQALTAAAECGHVEIVELLIDKGANVDDGWGLAAAAARGHVEIVELLIGNGAEFNRRLFRNMKTRGGDLLEAMELLVEKGARIPREVLEEALYDGNQKVVKLLIDKVVDFNAEERKTFELAAAGGYQKAIELLIEMDVDIDKNRALNWAACEGYQKLVELLIEKGANVDADEGLTLYGAVQGGDIEMVKLLISLGADINISEGEALAEAARENNIEMVKLLISLGASINMSRGKALAEAVQKGNIEMVKLLKSLGADINISEGRALSRAAWKSDIKMVELLKSLGADINTGRGRVLTQTVENGNIEMVKLLKGLKADINAGTGQALDEALWRDNIEMVKLLISLGADVNVGEGSPLTKVVERGDVRMAKLLISLGADVNAGEGRVLAEAMRRGDIRMVELLKSLGAVEAG